MNEGPGLCSVCKGHCVHLMVGSRRQPRFAGLMRPREQQARFERLEVRGAGVPVALAQVPPLLLSAVHLRECSGGEKLLGGVLPNPVGLLKVDVG